MKITFPHMGNMYIPVKILFDGLGIDYIIPPFNNSTALQLGIKYSPEEICLPFKIMIGNYIQSIKQGADTILLVGSCGPCRFGEYCELQMNILKKLGFKNLNFIVLDYPNAIGKKEFFKRLNKISYMSHKTTFEKINALVLAFKAANLIDEIENSAHYLAGYETNKGECKKILTQCKLNVLEENNPLISIKILKNYKAELKKLSIDKNKKPVKVAIIGEIYTIIDSFSNLYIEDKLMDFSVCSSRKLTPSWWVKDAALKILKLNSINIRIASRKYLSVNIGGHARECVGDAILAQKKNLDGAIQIFPMGCMPEIVAKSILPSISRDKNFPIMTLIVDEMTGEAGYITRIEAFLDLLERRKKCII